MQQSSVVDYKALEQDRVNKSKAALREKLSTMSQKDLGRAGSLRRVILGYIVAERYEEGKTELLAHIERKSQYPNFLPRIERYIQHAVELIHAIHIKRSFPGLASLSLSKQQEIVEKVLTHFDELKHTLRIIERVEKDVRLEDLRATTMPVKVFSHCLVLLMTVAFVLSLQNGIGHSFLVTFEALVDDVTAWTINLLHW